MKRSRRAGERIWRLLLISSWVALVVGVITSIAAANGSLASLGSVVVASIWVLVLTVIPQKVLLRPLVIDAIALGGAILCMTAVTLTGASTSPFLILALMPTMIASAVSGSRSGIATASLTGALLIAVTLSQGSPATPALGISLLYLLIGVTVAQIKKMLFEAEAHASSLERSTVVTRRRLDDLEEANQLLVQLAELTANADTSPITLGRTALERLAERFPRAFLATAINGDNGPIVVAKVGTRPEGGDDQTLGLTVSGHSVGYVRIHNAEPLSAADLDSARIGLEPLALAFSNARLLHSLTVNAVKAERTRLARELHDEIGPSLASLGLALDVAMFQGSESRELTEHLRTLRDRVGSIVDEVRTTVTDLRTQRLESLKSHLKTVAAQLDTSIDIERLDERRPIRPSLAEAVYAIAGEALRNAIRHSPGESVEVFGWIDFDRGRIVIGDRGPGFDPDADHPGHFGLVGMRERAATAGLFLDINSSATGTRVVLAWGTL